MPKLLEILTDPNSKLREKTSEIKQVSPEIITLIDDMVETMRKKDGMGLAAPQVGVALKLAIVESNSKEKGDNPAPLPLTIMLNPKIISFGEIFEEQEEGCLSVPGKEFKIIRPTEINVLYFDMQGRRHRLRAKGMPARVIQHEIDHLNGILITDRFALQQKEE